MYKCLNFILVLSLILVLMGCATNNGNEPDNPYSNADYFVKYEASIKSVYSNTANYTVRTENGSEVFKSGRSFSQTFGPFKKGFEAAITVDAHDWNQADCEARIYICRGDEPFVLKAHDSGWKGVYVSYTIDY